MGPAFRAIPFPEVTELICRLPLLTLIYSPEAFNLGDLMRLSVRFGSIIFTSVGFSRTDPRIPDVPINWNALPSFGPYLDTRSFKGPTARQTEQRFLPGPVADVPEFVCVAATTRDRIREL